MVLDGFSQIKEECQTLEARSEMDSFSRRLHATSLVVELDLAKSAHRQRDSDSKMCRPWWPIPDLAVLLVGTSRMALPRRCCNCWSQGQRASKPSDDRISPDCRIERCQQQHPASLDAVIRPLRVKLSMRDRIE